MILQRLAELYDRLKEDEGYQIPPFGFSSQKIGFRVVLSTRGELVAVQDIREEEDGKPRPIQMIVPGGDKPPGGVTEKSASKKVHLLRNDMPFLLGAKISEKNGGEEAAGSAVVPSEMEFRAFRDRHLAIEEAVDDPHFSAVCTFLRAWNPGRAADHPEWEKVGTLQGVFQIQGVEGYVHQQERVRSWWGEHNKTWRGEKEVDPVQCLVTGTGAPPARIHPSIKGIRGGNTTGGGIVGFDKPAFESYGHTQSFNAPVSEEVAFKYVTALNALLNGPQSRRHCLTLGNQDAPLTVVFWTDKPSPLDDIFTLILGSGSHALDAEESQDEGVRTRVNAFLEALRVGLEAFWDLGMAPDGTRFFLLGLTPNSARIAVKFFFTSSFAELVENLRKHHRDIEMVPEFKSDPAVLPMWRLLDQTCLRTGKTDKNKRGKPDRRKIPPILAAPLFSAILRGARYPSGLFSAVMSRIRADRIVNYPRACIIKGYLTRNLRKEVSMGLDPQRLDPSYRIGRLFAALEKTQKDALGENLNATIRDRFFGAASATPGTVFPRLLRTYQHHLSKLEGGLRIARERLVQGILEPLDGFPSHLDLTEQGLFALGYYHQNHDFYTPKKQTPAEA